MSLVAEQAAFLSDVRRLLEHAEGLGYTVTLGEAYRTIEQQQLHVRAGRSKTMKSEHLNRRAIDLNLFLDGKLCNREQVKPLGEIWESLHLQNRWGGSWRGLVESGRSEFIDVPHFERQG